MEIKLRLPNKEAHNKVAEALKDAYIETHDQENFFYEGSEKELNKAKVSLRTRFYGGDKKCVITMKVIIKPVRCLSFFKHNTLPTVSWHSVTASEWADGMGTAK